MTTATPARPPTPSPPAGPPAAGCCVALSPAVVRGAWWSGPRAELWASITAGAMLLVGWLLHRFGDIQEARVLVWASLAIGAFYGGRPALEAVRARRFDIDVLMVVGAGFAAWLGHPEDGALLLFLFVLAGSLEDLAMERTRREVEALHKLMPTEAVVRREGEWVQSDPALLRPGERVRIGPGELVPADATVVLGASSMDQATITGESLPREVEVGDAIYAGTINVGHPIEATVVRPASESSLQKILDLVTRARESREPVQRLIDRLSEPYAIGVAALSLGVLLVWRLAFGEAWDAAMYTAITLLIVASPCALVIATPTATLAAIARGARAGVLFKGGQSIERLARIGSICFDKTGTLTIGRPRLSQVHPVAWSDGGELLAVAAGLEASSTHPIASAVREAAAARGVEPAPVESVTNIAGRGVAGIYQGRPARLGSYRHTEELIPICLRARVKEVLTRIQHRGQIGVVVAWGGVAVEGDKSQGAVAPAEDTGQRPMPPEAGAAAVLIMADAVRPGARGLVDRLHALGVRPVRMLTGDNRITAEGVATALGIDRWDAELLPQDKVAAVEEMKRERDAPAAGRWRGWGNGRRGAVGVIGDGVNDAPALAAADVAVAIGSIGSDAALESADIVLLSDDLLAVPWAVRLARATRATIAINFAIALSAIVVMGTVTLVGSRTGWRMPLSLAVLGHEGGTLLVVLSSLRLLLVRGVEGDPERVDAGAEGATLSTAPASCGA